MSEQTGPRTTAPPPGWYADPAGSGGTRWWDGTAWTDQVGRSAPGGQPGYGQPGYGAAGHLPAGPPGYAEPAGAPAAWPGGPPLAGVGARFVALLLDGLIVAGAALLVALVTALLVALLLGTLGESVGNTIAVVVGIVIYLGLVVASFAYEILLQAGPYGQTIGKAVAGVRVVRADTGGRLSVGQSAGRVLARSFLSGSIFGLGYIWAFFDDRHRAWHDMLAETLVITADASSRPSARELLRTARAPR
jgi:uncharacterized RDD family membrane protein YckC